jgi:hypothetical protein
MGCYPRSLFRPVTQSLDAWPRPTDIVPIPSDKAVEDLFKELPAMRLILPDEEHVQRRIDEMKKDMDGTLIFVSPVQLSLPLFYRADFIQKLDFSPQLSQHFL